MRRRCMDNRTAANLFPRPVPEQTHPSHHANVMPTSHRKIFFCSIVEQILKINIGNKSGNKKRKTKFS
jgi:hypothetical protein